MAEPNFSILGIDALSEKLKTVSDDMRFKGGRFALRKSANLVRDAAKANAMKINDPKTAEDISANIATRWSSKFFKRTGDLKFRVGVLGGARALANTRENRRKRRAGKVVPTPGDKRNPGGDTFHWRFAEFGTSRSRAQPFFRRSLSDNVSAATNEFVVQYDKALVRALRRAETKKPSPK